MNDQHQIDQARTIARQLGIKFALKAASLDMLPQRADPDTYLPDPEYSRYEQHGETLTSKGACTPATLSRLR